MAGYRFYYDKDYDYLYQEELKYFNERESARNAKNRLRMYANLYNRDMRKVLLNADSVCAECESTENLQLDHKHPVMAGGRNELSNLQILCKKCNRQKGGNHGK